jgi:catechol 2,3-dioxygenase-like lactoylglutathione lyase family enzyme
MSTVSVRYIVDDVDEAIAFYCNHLGFSEERHPDPAFAVLARGELRLVIVSPVGPDQRGAGARPKPDGTKQEPGGAWNRFMLEVPDLASTVDSLRKEGIDLRNEIVTGVGNKQILLNDPSGNPIELYEPSRRETRPTDP